MVYTLCTTAVQISEKMAFLQEVEVRFINRKGLMHNKGIDHKMVIMLMITSFLLFCFFVVFKSMCPCLIAGVV